MLDYVEKCLLKDAEYPESAKSGISYSRFEHTKRVLGWVKRLYDKSSNKDNLGYEALIIATRYISIYAKPFLLPQKNFDFLNKKLL